MSPGRVLILGAVAVLVIVLQYTPDQDEPRDLRAERCSPDGKSWAFTMSHEFVKQRLRSPSTAEFPWSYTDRDGIDVNHLGGCKFEVTGYVDAQNGFGAMVRSNYFAELEYVPERDNWLGSAEIFR